MGDFGHFFYFTNYDGASSSKFIVRYALFLGKTNALFNRSSDPKRGPNPLTTRLYDKMGEWAKDFDSLYVGKVKLSDGKYHTKQPIIVLKDFNQHHVLSWHYMNKKYIK